MRIHREGFFSQASEIVESIKWVGRDHPEIKQALGRLLDTYDRNKWECMNRSAGHSLSDPHPSPVTEPDPITGPVLLQHWSF